MDDIVKRLRNRNYYSMDKEWAKQSEAANEIERLRAAILDCSGTCGAYLKLKERL